MASFKGGDPEVKETKTYTANPLTAQYAANLGTQAGSLPGAGAVPLQGIQQFTQDQIEAFQGARNAQGIASPYLASARNFIEQGGQPIDMGQVAALYKQMSDPVFASQNNLFGQQRSQNTGNVTQAAGGVGADRIGVAQANLAGQQALAQGQTGSGLLQNAINTYMQQRQQQQAAGTLMGQLGGQAQGAAYTDVANLYGMGGQQQQLGQAINNAQFAQQMGQYQNPYQNLAAMQGAVGTLSGALGGTQDTTTRYPEQGWGATAVGLGTAALSAYMGNPAGVAGGMRMASGTPQQQQMQNNGYYAYGAGGLNPRAAVGGRIEGHIELEDGQQGGVSGAGPSPSAPLSGYPSQPQSQPQTSYGAPGQPPSSFADSFLGRRAQAGPMPAMPGPQMSPTAGGGGKGSMVAGLASNPALPQQLSQLFAPRAAGGRVDPYAILEKYASGGVPHKEGGGSMFGGMGFEPVGWREGAYEPGPDEIILPPKPNPPPMPGAIGEPGRGPWQDPSLRLPPSGAGVPSYAPEDDSLPPAARPSGPAPMPPAIGGGPQGGLPPMPDVTQRPDQSSRMAQSPWLALMQAGLATAAASGQRDARGLPTPFGSAIGQGGMQGVKVLQEQQKADREERRVEMEGKRLLEQARMSRLPYTQETVAQRRSHDIQERPYTEMTAAQREQADRAREEFEHRKKQADRPYKELTKAQELEALKPFKIGVDDDGGDVYGVRDPNDGKIKRVNPITGEFISGAAPIDENKLEGQAYLDSLEPGRRGLIQGIIEGRIAPPSASNVRSPRTLALLKQIARVDPSFDATVWKSRNETRAAFAKGVEGRSVTSHGTVVGHLSDMRETIDKLAKHSLTPWNKVENAVKDRLGAPALADYKVARTAVADELAKLFQGSGVTTEHAKQRWLDALDDARSPQQFRAVMGRLLSLMDSRMDALAGQYNRGMTYGEDDPKAKTGISWLDKKQTAKHHSLKDWASIEETKVMDGKTYGRRGKEWFLME